MNKVRNRKNSAKSRHETFQTGQASVPYVFEVLAHDLRAVFVDLRMFSGNIMQAA